jgi:hypothetical protein
MQTILTPSQLKAAVGTVLDQAVRSPQYVVRNGVLLVIQKAELPDPDAEVLSPWEQRASVLESFYDSNKTW